MSFVQKHSETIQRSIWHVAVEKTQHLAHSAKQRRVQGEHCQAVREVLECQWRFVAGPLWRGGWRSPRWADGGQSVGAVIMLEMTCCRLWRAAGIRKNASLRS